MNNVKLSLNCAKICQITITAKHAIICKNIQKCTKNTHRYEKLIKLIKIRKNILDEYNWSSDQFRLLANLIPSQCTVHCQVLGIVGETSTRMSQWLSLWILDMRMIRSMSKEFLVLSGEIFIFATSTASLERISLNEIRWFFQRNFLRET